MMKYGRGTYQSLDFDHLSSESTTSTKGRDGPSSNLLSRVRPVLTSGDEREGDFEAWKRADTWTVYEFKVHSETTFLGQGNVKGKDGYALVVNKHGG